MLKRWLHWFQRQMRLSSAWPAPFASPLDEVEMVVAAVEGAGVLPFEPEVAVFGLWL